MSKKNAKKIVMINGTDLSFNDITTERFREYQFPNGKTYRIEQPLAINVSSTGGHRVFSADGVSHYVQPKEGWAIKWKAHKGQPNFVK